MSVKMHKITFSLITLTALVCVAGMLFLPACATYYQRNIEFQQHFEKGEIEPAKDILQKTRKARRKRVKLLYYLNSGMLYHLLGDYQKSAEYFTQADYHAEDFRRNWGAEILAAVSNPTVKPYPGEDYEIVMIHYYNALNFLKMNNHNAALIETRRMNIKLQQLQDRYKREMVYKRDAFGHNLMGLIYDATGDYNNAFIAYRNAYNIYSEDYTEHYGLSAPTQLKKDLLRAALRSGFREDLEKYKREFSLEPEPFREGEGEVIVFWDNGLGPVKDEWSINFTILRGQAGFVTFVNEEHGFSFPFFIGNTERESQLTDLKLVRVAFPKMQERPSIYSSAYIRDQNNRRFPLEKAQDVTGIAFKSLQDRFLREMGNALLRLALKQLSERAAREVHDGLGLAVTIANALTEKADTRNWQTLPNNIQYTRLKLPAGKHHLTFVAQRSGQTDERTLEINVLAGRTTFETIRTFRSLPQH